MAAFRRNPSGVWLAAARGQLRPAPIFHGIVCKEEEPARRVTPPTVRETRALQFFNCIVPVKVLDGGATDAGRPYFVMELVRGTQITEYCDEKSLGTRERLDLFIKVCQAIQHAHQKGIIHRDIKPSNILVTINDGAAVPKVIDFGIAKATEGRLTDKTPFTHFEALIGTPGIHEP